MTRIVQLTALLLLGACSGPTVIDEATRLSAIEAVSKALPRHFPAIPAPAVPVAAECVVDNSKVHEVLQFADDAVSGVDKNTVALTATALNRPDTQKCMAKAGLTASTA